MMTTHATKKAPPGFDRKTSNDWCDITELESEK